VVAFLVTKTDKTTVARFLRIDWDTVGRICQRVVVDGLDADYLESRTSRPGAVPLTWAETVSP
jgi:hypothetical protein